MQSLQSLGYLPIATAGLTPASVLSCDLFVLRPGRTYAELFRGNNYPLGADDVNHLRESGIDHLYIRLADADAYRTYLCENVLHDPRIPLSVRMKALREVTRVAFEDAFTAGDCAKVIQVANNFGSDLANMVADQSPAFGELFKTLEHDYYTFTHVCNVSVYLVMLAKGLSTSATADLAALATAGLLHDLGKRSVPQQILNKSGKLTDDEWALLMEHPTTGFRELSERGDLSWEQLMVVYQHHERLDGSGYPTGVSGDEIHPWAKLCGVVDVFDAMTCHRPYRKAAGSKAACDHLRQRAGAWFDAEAVNWWTSQIERMTQETIS
jgi:HD-GYP domain-containing protein (c-di-GMP phosphodiesterase class II)